MADKERPLPKPPKTPFGKKRMSEEDQEGQGPLLAEQLAMAAAAGKLDEFMQTNLPDNEHARKLVMMMMGMTGMMPPQGFSAPDDTAATDSCSDNQAQQDQSGSGGSQVPEGVMKAVHEGDMHQLMELLKQEHQKRTGSDIQVKPLTAGQPGAVPAPSGIEKELLDQLIDIASKNSVTLDWLIMRAIKVYIDDYRKTGRL